MSSQKNKGNSEMEEYIVEKILNKRVTDDNKIEYFVKWKDLPDSNNEWKLADVLNYPELVRVYESSLKNENSDKKRKFSGTESACSESFLKKKACVEETVENMLNINCLPEEILLEIFRYLPHTEFGNIARVCKTWHELTRCPSLWKNMVRRFQKPESKNNESITFSKNLPPHVTHLKLDFMELSYVELDTLCFVIGEKCPSLKTFIINDIWTTISFQTAIDLCSQYMPNLEALSFQEIFFSCNSIKRKFSGVSKIKVLDLHNCSGIAMIPFSNMPNLKKLHLVSCEAKDAWFEGDTSFFYNLEILSLQFSRQIVSRTFKALQNYALQLTELYLCVTKINDSDCNFSAPVFPQLKTVCLRKTPELTYEGIVCFVRSCESLQNVYLDEDDFELYVEHPFIIDNKHKLQIVKTTVNCIPHHKNECFFEW